MISVRDNETTSIADENHRLNENHENSKLQTINPSSVVPGSSIADRPGLAMQHGTILVIVSVIEY